MTALDRRRFLTGLAFRYPELKLGAEAGVGADELSDHFGIALVPTDVADLAALTPDQIADFRQALEQSFADVYPYGI